NTLKLFYIINTFVVYLVFLGPSVLLNKDNDSNDILSANLYQYLDVKNILPALLVSFLAINSFRIIYNLITKNKSIPNHTFDVGIWSLTPIIINILIFGLVAIFIDKIPSIINFNDIVLDLVGRPFKHLGNSFGSGALLTATESLMWFFGIHGGNALESVKLTAFEYSSNEVISKTFLDTFVLMGGCGTLLCFSIAIIVASNRRRSRHVTYMSMGPMIFNINEISVFGIPLVLNPIFLIPFMLVPFSSYCISYFFMSTGIIPCVTNTDVYWTTPILFSGYLATDSVWGSVLQVINLFIGVLIYLPFVKLDNYVALKSNNRIVKELTNYVKECENNTEKTHIFDLDPTLSRVAESIANKIEYDSNNGDIEMFYQPLYKDNRIYSVESLLRFKYKDNYLYPPLVINIAKEKGIFQTLSKAITKRVLHDLEGFTDVNINIRASINLQYSLIADRAFMKWFFDTIKTYNIPTTCVGIEITEESSIPIDIDMAKVFNNIREKDIKVYLDDFSMGKTSITYLQNNHFDYVKLDGSLVKNLDNERSRDIVLSIVKLGKDLDFDVIAEYVENETIVSQLSQLGCNIYQGYYYSKPLNYEDFIILLQDDLSKRHREIFEENKIALKKELKEKKAQYKKPTVDEKKKENKTKTKNTEPKKKETSTTKKTTKVPAKKTSMTKSTKNVKDEEKTTKTTKKSTNKSGTSKSSKSTTKTN
ncbi:MAG: EAL domain-containing protein, partial [Acholeplasmatales bacterium]|nr:EAL domain-containing protein [Acholeplasmatales bacterium]